MAPTDAQNKAKISALLEELRGYEAHGKKDRAEQVKEQLKALGHKAAAPAKRATKATAKKGTKA